MCSQSIRFCAIHLLNTYIFRCFIFVFLLLLLSILVCFLISLKHLTWKTYDDNNQTGLSLNTHSHTRKYTDPSNAWHDYYVPHMGTPSIWFVSEYATRVDLSRIGECGYWIQIQSISRFMCACVCDWPSLRIQEKKINEFMQPIKISYRQFSINHIEMTCTWNQVNWRCRRIATVATVDGVATVAVVCTRSSNLLPY